MTTENSAHRGNRELLDGFRETTGMEPREVTAFHVRHTEQERLLALATQTLDALETDIAGLMEERGALKADAALGRLMRTLIDEGDGCLEIDGYGVAIRAWTDDDPIEAIGPSLMECLLVLAGKPGCPEALKRAVEEARTWEIKSRQAGSTA